jgi:cytochrome c oxidase subunit 4
MSVESPGAAPHAVRLRGYLAVFVALLCLTFVTVFVSTLHLTRPRAIAIALAIAALKASLVAAVFMHLVSEKKIIYTLLGFTALFFGLVFFLPLWTSPGGLVAR